MLLLSQLLKRLFRRGTLTAQGPDGEKWIFGDGHPPHVGIRIHDHRTARKLFFDPQLELGEAFMDERFTVEDGEIYDFLALAMQNIGYRQNWFSTRLLDGVRRIGKRIQQYNPRDTARQNVAHHYDLRGELYDLFLDEDRQYSCAYFQTLQDSLEMAQVQKKRHIASKLLLKPGQRVLDIGSGWGGLALHLAEMADIEVVGLTLSEEQFKRSNRRAAERGLSHRVQFKLLDYREEMGIYDRIVSVGMFEHVGVNQYDEYFSRIRDLLQPDGVALLHTIGRAEGPGVTNAWIRKYIFPGGYSPALSEVMPAIERSGLFTTDIEILRLHYAETLRQWRQRFLRNRAEIRALFDERFCRMWEFYLASSEATFRWGGHVNFQIQMEKQLGTVPLTRDYMFNWERAHGIAEAVAPPAVMAD